MELSFRQVDVFAAAAFQGNPLAVVLGADDLTDAQMARIANWTNLSETTFLLRPRHPDADYRVRIFTPDSELPFAGHPTLGSAFVWESAGGVPRADAIVQECGAGLVRIRRDADRLSFAAPPRLRSGPVDAHDLGPVLSGLRLARTDVLDAEWADNGPGWMVLRLSGRQAVLGIRPDWGALKGHKVGVVGAWDPVHDGPDAQFEVRAFIGSGQGYEDPVTGSLNAGIAQWLVGDGIAPPRYVASQGTALGRAGRVFVERADDALWIGGAVVTRIAGRLVVTDD
ncbi:phenazine biosynthesis PhzC/PhzF protein [Ameyamaea chiangmaiensis NBRC 103196]|uniref:PhzF family phenazine biosynthesis protein n=1 Tax=Ameyamaea chiangmaiensis TaxID=442969 RepID=A0A850PEY6_9PROT|nr:PhzF family phenazine biosynthesis protein [Ameyamaea chiangmaiensis]MBS4076137.1 PhzF family phenazine biosynthesis protein [Ameyamaea chiangmaiensis]NVN39651.1 PhzF family phenazine biosynthesis protein [Ameyamaea chiangmaiensis]GBQ67158.1 phenazine biosynthesis PhzC/PhzF protein [Ameyamaea chiangmaiensis NBRC 103196]